MDNLKDELVRAFGTQIINEYSIILQQISAIIAAHLFAGSIGDNPLCVLNRAIEEVINKK